MIIIFVVDYFTDEEREEGWRELCFPAGEIDGTTISIDPLPPHVARVTLDTIAALSHRSSNFVLQDMSDVCVGTSVGTITEPECLGPCEPGTSVTLEGIVWHETEGGKNLVTS